MNGLKQYAVFVPNKEQKFMSELTDTNMETETSLLYTREGFEALLASGNVKIYNAEKIIQKWLVDEGKEKADNYTMRIRRTISADLQAPHRPKHGEEFVERTHTVKHKLMKSTCLEVNTGLSRNDYLVISNHYHWCPEVNKTRLYLICKGINMKAAVVTMDIYNDDEMRLEIELTNAKEGIIIPEYLYTFASHPED